MSNVCALLHNIACTLKRHSFPFNESTIPENELYFLFEKSETAHGTERIVRVGTHTGRNQLRSRLKQHFLNENKDRSIFRKNVGRALLNKENNPFLKQWDRDLTTRVNKDKYSQQIDFTQQKQVECKVSQIIQANFSISVFEVKDKAQRIEIESKLISSVSWCDGCRPSADWLGNYSPKAKIRESGLWLVNELYKRPYTIQELENLAGRFGRV